MRCNCSSELKKVCRSFAMFNTFASLLAYTHIAWLPFGPELPCGVHTGLVQLSVGPRAALVWRWPLLAICLLATLWFVSWVGWGGLQFVKHPLGRRPWRMLQP